MKYIALLAFIAFFIVHPSLAFAQDDLDWNMSSMTDVELRNRYGDASDEIGLDDARKLMLKLVNSDRHEYDRLLKLRLQKLACDVAQAHAEDMADNRYLGHYDRSGWKAPERYNAAGGTDMVIENVSYWEVENFEAVITPQIVKNFEERWIRSPGHHRAIMTPQATHLGFGIALARHGNITVITAVQLFVVDKSDFKPVSGRIRRRGKESPVVKISGRLHSGVAFFYAAVGMEPLPEPMTPEFLNKNLSSYQTPEPFAGYLEQVAEGRQRLSNLQTRYTFALGPNGLAVKGQVELGNGDGSPGLYYIYVFVRDADGNVYPIMIQTCEVV